MKDELKFKQAVIDTEMECMLKKIDDLQKEVRKLKDDIAYLNMLERLDEEYGDMFEGDK